MFQNATPQVQGFAGATPFQGFSGATPMVEDSPPQISQLPEAGTYSENDLTQPELLGSIRRGMVTLYGEQFQDMEDDDLVNKFLNSRRGVAGGNSYRGVREVMRLNQLDDSELSTVGEMYSIYENMAGLYSGETTAGEKLSGTGDFLREAILDPVNVLSLGVGKAFALGGGKAAIHVARQAAMKAYKDAILARATKEVAEAAGQKVFNAAMQQAGKETAEQITARTLQSGIRNTAIREIGASTAFDAAVAVGTDLAYQEGLIRTGVQDDYSFANTGLAAFGVMTLGGISAGLTGLRGVSGLKPLDQIEPADAAKVFQRMGRDLNKPDVPTDRWRRKVAAGLNGADDLQLKLWPRLLFGDEEDNVQGLMSYFLEEGFSKQDPEQRIADWIGEILRKAPPEVYTKFVDDVSEAIGLPKEKLGISTVDDFVNVISAQASQAGRMLNTLSVSQKALNGVARKTQKAIEDVTPEEYWDYMFDYGIGKPRTKGDDFIKKFDGAFVRLQNNTIRMIVSNLGTTALNVQGYGMSSMWNSASDITMGILHGGDAALNLVLGRVDKAKAAANAAKTMGEMQYQKVKNLIDSNTTYDSFMSIALARPAAMRELMSTISGGVDDLKTAQKVMGFDPDMTKAGFAQEKAVDFFQNINLVKAQDVATKSQEYMYQLDKGVRLLGQGTLADKMADTKEFLKFMNSETFMDIHTKAVYETQRAIFSKSYKGRGTVGEIAGMIEDMRNIPVIGLLVPFGRFFNNTIAAAMDATGMSIAYKYFTKGYEGRSQKELFARVAVSVGLVSSIVDSEADLIDKGVDWDEGLDPNTGEVISYRYSFPYSMFKAAGRLLAYHREEIEVPEDVRQDISQSLSENQEVVRAWAAGETPKGVSAQMMKNVFGQLTRDLSSAGDGVITLVQDLLEGDANVMESVAGALGKSATQVVSAWTRTLEPLNHVAAIARGTNFKDMDRRQGNELINESIRYIDQFVMAFGLMDTPEQRYTAAGGSTNLDPGKFVGVRSTGQLSNTERVLNRLGVEDWSLNSRSMNPEADNRFNKYFNSVIEDRATRLWESRDFQSGDLERKNALWSREVTKAREQVLGLMKSSVQSADDPLLQKSMQLSLGHGEDKINRAMEATGVGDIDYTDLTYRQLEVLEAFLKHEQDVLDLGYNRN